MIVPVDIVVICTRVAIWDPFQDLLVAGTFETALDA